MTQTPSDHDRPDRHLEILVDVGPDAPVSPRLAAALDELAAALAEEEIGDLLEEFADDDVAGFSFDRSGRTFGDIGFSPGAKHICIIRNTSGSGPCGSWCSFNTDGDTDSCAIMVG